MSKFSMALLALPAGLALTQGASAADMPQKSKGPEIEYVRICDTFGNGFFFIPGSNTCLKVSGYIRVDYLYRQTRNVSSKKIGGLNGATGVNSNAALDSSGFRTRARAEFDARSNTEYGPLRGFVRLQGQASSGVLGGASSTGTVANDVILDVGYIQWAGITAGRQKSFFEGFGSGPDYPLDNARAYDTKTQMLAYTAKFGSGFAATLSIEDPVVRRGAVFGVINPLTGVGAPVGVTYGGSKLPDIVANLRADGEWGAVMVSGAAHQVNTIRDAAIGSPKANATGWAALAGVLIKLPSLAKGDEIFVQGAYASGAKSYLSLGNIGSTSPFGLERNDADAVAVRDVALTGQYHLEKSHGYTLQAGLTHYWAPNFFQRVWAAYTVLDYGTATRNVDWQNGGLGRGRDLIAVTNFTWQPAKNLDIALDLSYSKMTQTLPHFVGFAPSALPAGLKKDSSTFATRLRLLRSF